MRRYGRKSRQDRRGRALARQHTAYAPAVGSNGRAGAGTQRRAAGPATTRCPLIAAGNEAAPTICYARVSPTISRGTWIASSTIGVLLRCQGLACETLRDLGSGMNHRKKGLNRLLEIIMRRQARRLVLTHKDRLLRFGARAGVLGCAKSRASKW